MTESGKKHISKWDLKVETDVPAESREDNYWPDKPGKSIHNKESSSGLNSPKVAGSQDPRWSMMESNKSLEQLPAKRGVDLDDSLNRDINEISQSMTGWGGDRGYSSSMSPGLDAWRQQNQSHSPKCNWRSLRSRSRSPPHGFKRESDHKRDRSSSGSGVSAPTCNDFAAGMCRRGGHCRLLHQDNQEVQRCEDSGTSESGPAGNWGSRSGRGSFLKHSNSDELIDYSRDMISHGYGDREKYEHPRNDRSTNRCNDFLKGKCYKGSSCKYAHHDALSDGYGGWSGKDVTKDRVHDRREAHEYDHGRGPFRNNGIPCKYFAAGNCRNGVHCRFSHDGGRCSLEDRSQGDRWGHNLDNVEKSPYCRPDSGDRQVGFNEPRETKRPEDQWGHSSANENRSWEGPTRSDKAAGQNLCRTPHPSENNAASMNIRESIGAGKPLDVADTSSAAAVTERYPLYINTVEHRQFPQDLQSRTPDWISLPTCEQKTTQESLHQPQHPSLRGDAAIAFPRGGSNILPMVPMPGKRFNHDGQSGGSSSFNMIGQSEQIVPPHLSRGRTLNLSREKQSIISESPSSQQGQTLIHMGGPTTKSEMEVAKTSKVASVAPLHNVVTSEQVVQMTTLSASLAQIFGNGLQLPQLYAALNPPNSIGFVPSQPSPAAMSTTVTLPSNDPNQTAGSQKPYDPMVSIESCRPVTSNQPPVYSPITVEQNKVAEQMPLKSSVPSSLKNNFSDDTLKHESHKSEQLEPVVACEAVVKNDNTDQRKKDENGHSEDMDVDIRVDEECKKSKDVKAMRMFKFALVEFVKEILKPTWKGGQMSKEAHKTIVKKVVDKVTVTIEEAHVPETQEKIDHYLSYSRPKLTKLVQAYVGKYLKSLTIAGKP
ncbi:zinc finger CCCH domain-containing protein 55-like isoform X2 [Telopea speciosissima]|uniref:zinc finger CCCH domain-containing protein 55-like isoform X2 n=1 Tax=Telopea speciosissima TaxID=54955 RepID=UPI001CC79782|nr:zinc finger CCCH domain-containing protein 55-like isoform X2 [Telopea speciosissima]